MFRDNPKDQKLFKFYSNFLDPPMPVMRDKAKVLDGRGTEN